MRHMPSFNYSVAKVGVAGLTKYMAGALGPWGINVNAIAPGPTLSEATKKRGARADHEHARAAERAAEAARSPRT